MLIKYFSNNLTSKKEETNHIKEETKMSINRGHLSWALKGEEKVSKEAEK